ncbi:hypothetical protein RRG08_015250 [Elysia crispata]|uniref:Uncharacterized protein n=1 Tax=Elysia crispata TaxID=231223 RepID=A0AAE0Z173_9GAST|nr:hypothetical protein RRG08_015250 [Elysia crispata]
MPTFPPPKGSIPQGGDANKCRPHLLASPRFAPRFLREGEGFLPPPLERFAPVTVRRPRTTFPSGIGGWATCLPKTLALRGQPSALAPPQGTFARGSGGFDNHSAAQDRFIGGVASQRLPSMVALASQGVCPPRLLPLGGNHYQSFDNMPFGHGESNPLPGPCPLGCFAPLRRTPRSGGKDPPAKRQKSQGRFAPVTVGVLRTPRGGGLPFPSGMGDHPRPGP